MLGKVFKAYDIRATYPKPLNEKLAWQIGYATAQFLTEQAAAAGEEDPMMRHIVVGRDMRQSSPALAKELKQGMKDFGANIIDVGMVDTPFVSFAINHLGCCGGVQVTASHNPAHYNGFKISRMGAKPVGMTTGLDDIRKYAAMVDCDKINPARGREDERDLWDAYRTHVLQSLDPRLMDATKTIHIVIDASNGMAGTMIPRVFDHIKGIKITRLNFDNASGDFVHEPNPLVEANLAELKEKTVELKANAGVCFDGDADRCVVVDEKGRSIGCDLLTAWLAGQLLETHPGAAVVYDLRSSKALPEVVRNHKGRPVKSRVGHVFIKQKMAEHDAIFGGELSGHFYFRDNFYADSGGMAFVAVLNGLVRTGKPLSAQIGSIRRYSQSGEINFETESKEHSLIALTRAYPDADIEELDGITLDMGEWWCNVRMSNTEPLLRLNLEAASPEMVALRVREVARYLGRRVAH